MSIYYKVKFAISTLISVLILKFNGCKLKGMSYFCGLPYIKNKGSISVGNSCMFISSETSNSIGLNHRCMLTTQSKLSHINIGNNCGFSGCTLWCFSSIEIGNNVRVGANCLIMDGDCHQDDPRSGDNLPIVIEDNVWLGANVIVLKGVHIGRNSLIGINSVVTADIPSNVIAVGNPCKVIRNLSESQILKLESQ